MSQHTITIQYKKPPVGFVPDRREKSECVKSLYLIT